MSKVPTQYKLDPNIAPFVQIAAKRKETGKHIVYMPHVGAKQKAKALKRLAKQQAKLETK